MREDIRHLGWGILFVSWSMTLGLFGFISLDLLPDVVGVCFFWHFLVTYGGPQSLGMRLCRLYALIYSVLLFFPLVWMALHQRLPFLGEVLTRGAGLLWVVCLGILLGRCFALLGTLAEKAGRQDLAAGARRFRQAVWCLYALRALTAGFGMTQLEGAAALLWLALNLLLAAFAANCQPIAPALPPDTDQPSA